MRGFILFLIEGCLDISALKITDTKKSNIDIVSIVDV